MLGICVCALAWQAHGQERESIDDGTLPDFSGVWGRTRLEFEPPHSGAGPVMETSQIVGIIAGDHTNPILQPWAADIVRDRAEAGQTGPLLPNAHNTCQLEGVPYVFAVREMQIIQSPTQVTLLYNSDHQVRFVALNAAHTPNPEPTWFGDSVGHYEGDTLVIDTIGIKTTADTQVDRFGTPHTDALHVVERYRLVDSDTVERAAEPPRRRENARGVYVAQTGGKTLELQFTVEDQGAFTMPWGALVRSDKVLERDLMLEHVCAENNRDFFRTELFPTQTAVEPDF
nr:MAG: hypothetical protein E4H34_04685 [Hyphomicrobiales bacterium]